ncbi:MAG: TonB-dependent receptor plug domain-containing protein [candidate division Zixibacteria bacterium]|nr:TonB-dependent receptor plug domain-containing protein [candidate division Zixibacteria bacterium]
MRFLTCFVFLFALAVATGNGQTNEKVYQLPDTINVTAERFATPVNNIAWPARTIMAERVAYKNTLGDALNGISGADLTGYGQIGHLSNLFLWGSPSSQILLLYDGRPVYNYATGGFNLSDYDMTEIDRIELVKGTQSSLYGSEAIGGVINLIPKFEYLDQIEANLNYGSFSYMGYSLTAAKRFQNWYFNGMYNQTSTDNARDNSGVKRDNLSVKSVYLPPNRNLELNMSYRYFQDSLGLPGPVPAADNIPLGGNKESQSLYDYQQDFHHSFDARLKYNPDNNVSTSPLSVEADLFYEKKKLKYFTPLANYEIYCPDRMIRLNNNMVRNSGLMGRLKWEWDNFAFSGGLEFLSGSLRSEKINPTWPAGNYQDRSAVVFVRSFERHRRDTYAGWTEGTCQLNSMVEFSLSGRMESINGGDGYKALNAGIKIAPLSTLGFKAAYGNAYRLPALNDLYWPSDDYSEGNPKLIPEEGRNILFSAFLNPNSAISFNSNLFWRNVKNLISWAPVGSANGYGQPRWTPSNLNGFRSLGVDLSLIISPKWFPHIDADLTYQKAKQKQRELIFSGWDGTSIFNEVERKAAFIPDLKWRIGVREKLKYGFTCDLDIIYTSKKSVYYSVYAPDGQIGYVEKTMPPSYVVDFGLDIVSIEDFSISFSINDLFDDKPLRQFGTSFSQSGYPSLGRTLKVEINLTVR